MKQKRLKGCVGDKRKLENIPVYDCDFADDVESDVSESTACILHLNPNICNENGEVNQPKDDMVCEMNGCCVQYESIVEEEATLYMMQTLETLDNENVREWLPGSEL